ncbi:puromycin-sensitive aminopeptidase-like protein [Eurytemora carolleeae]|uniref:puromycin-sensitive aminopeptidase-like protein n=1 Tax=Eurytemora carolleeae TaxID=1294199 RepID=UPI000C7713AE|nr:puromycin-sensitive aminopeptidase-like protein [Eurytemora carolleeae]|eukprot:XP_023338813.1 puromycin-sensitive aminopeptidase-like protein [Eurytemora affinis]
MRGILLIIVLQVAAGSAQDDLASWGNHGFEVYRTKTWQDGDNLILGCIHQEWLMRESCDWTVTLSDNSVATYTTFPNGSVFQDGELVESVQGYDLEKWNSTCAIQIQNFQLELFGEEWNCLLKFSNPIFENQPLSTHIQGVLHLEDDLRTDLEQEIVPTHYTLSLRPDYLSTLSNIEYTGAITMDFINEEDRSEFIYFHVDGLDLTSATITNSDGDEDLSIDTLLFDFQKSTAGVKSDRILLKSAEYSLQMNFFANLSRGDYSAYGLYKTKCREGEEKYCWFTQFESTSARNAFPCIDNPDYKATFDISVDFLEGWNVLSNMPSLGTVDVDEDWKREIFQTTVPMSTYLIAFSISDFIGISSNDDRFLTVWSDRQDIEKGLGNYSADLGMQALELYENLFNSFYPLPKMDMVSVPGKGGAMENWGLVLYSPDTILYDQEEADLERHWRVTEVVLHELAHQWFGNLVTMKSWSQTWLNEGFATYVSHLGGDILTPDLNSWGRFVAHRMLVVMQEDENPELSWALSDDYVSRGDIQRKFGGITYHKGGSIIRMMEFILTRDTLIKGLSDYLGKMAFKNSIEEDLFSSLEAAGLEDGTWPQAGLSSFTEVMKSWTNTAGFPLVTAEYNQETGILNLKQKWYNTDGATDSSKIWPIPISIRVGPDTDYSLWLKNTDSNFEIDVPIGYTYILNHQAAGFFRVNYDSENWRIIGEVLRIERDIIHPFSRAQIICDVISFLNTGNISQEIADFVLGYIDVEDDSTVLLAYKECSTPAADRDHAQMEKI